MSLNLPGHMILSTLSSALLPWCQHLQKLMRGGLRMQPEHVLTLNMFDMWARESFGNSVKTSEYVQYSHLKRYVTFASLHFACSTSREVTACK